MSGKFSWKYQKTTEIHVISKVTVSLSLINTPCLIYFPSKKFHFAEETQMMLLAL